jgi:hypothetical protein
VSWAVFFLKETDLAPLAAGPPVGLGRDVRSGEIPARTEASDTLSADLKRRGFRFVGSTIVYALMQSIGLVDDHVPGCFRYVPPDQRATPAS